MEIAKSSRSLRPLLFLSIAIALLAWFGRPWWGSILSTDEFMPHGHCYLWRAGVVWLHVLSNGAIFLAYVSISSTLVYFVARRKDLPFDWMFMMFGAFVVLCGIGHLIDLVTLWKPVYWLSGVERGVTAAVSLTTAVILVPLVPKAMQLPSPAQLREANQKLQEEIAERKLAETELAEALSQLQEKQQILVRTEKLAAVGQLAASIGHELRNPLSAINNAVSYVAKKVTTVAHPTLDHRVPVFLEIMRREVEASTKIISSLLDYARERPPSLQPCVLSLLVDEAIEVVNRGRMKVENRVPKALPIPNLDRDQFRQVLVNLIQNAVDATLQERTSKGLTSSPSVVVSGEFAVKAWHVRVVDRGCGIPTDALPKVFEPLFTSKVKGTGLGLAIVKNIVKAHGGEISVESQVGEGTTVTVTLPVIASPPPVPKGSTSSEGGVS